MCRGSLAADALMQRAKSNDDRASATYFAGVKALVDGQRDTAAKWFRECVAVGAVEVDEFALARWHLELLKQNDRR